MTGPFANGGFGCGGYSGGGGGDGASPNGFPAGAGGSWIDPSLTVAGFLATGDTGDGFLMLSQTSISIPGTTPEPDTRPKDETITLGFPSK